MRGAKDMQDKMFRDIDSKQKEMVRSLIEMCRIPAYHPSSGGDGEAEKSRHLEGLVKEMGLKCKAYNAPDKSVSAGYRPNLLVCADRMPAKGKGALWLVAHTDVVPPGDLTAWTRPPFEPYEKGGKVFGRGVEDNGQAVISSLYALQAVARECPGTNAGVALVADEETGSGKGIQHLISRELFDRSDRSIIPDWGTDTGDSIEVAEKSMLWLRFTTEGKQVHASVPHTGINAFRAASKLLSRLDERLHERFGSTNELFQPPFSTFEPTKKEANVPNVNTVPGKDVFYFDCRVLPEYSLDDVVSIVKDQVSAIEREMTVKVGIDATLRETSPQTSEKSEIVRKLTRALKDLRGLEARPIGIGGGTCAAFFRKMGMDVAVWQTCDGMAHTVDECTRVRYLTEDAKVFAHVMTQTDAQ